MGRPTTAQNWWTLLSQDDSVPLARFEAAYGAGYAMKAPIAQRAAFSHMILDGVDNHGLQQAPPHGLEFALNCATADDPGGAIPCFISHADGSLPDSPFHSSWRISASSRTIIRLSGRSPVFGPGAPPPSPFTDSARGPIRFCTRWARRLAGSPRAVPFLLRPCPPRFASAWCSYGSALCCSDQVRDEGFGPI
jgi:hypothetical protein